MDDDDVHADVPGSSVDPLLHAYAAVTAHYRLDLQLYWQRANTYLLVQAVLLTFAGVVFGEEMFPTFVRLLFAFFGVLLAVIWWAVLRSSVIFKRRWRRAALQLDNAINDFRSYEFVERVRQGTPTYLMFTDDYRLTPPDSSEKDDGRPLLSPESLTMTLPFLFVATWIALGVYAAFFSDLGGSPGAPSAPGAP